MTTIHDAYINSLLADATYGLTKTQAYTGNVLKEAHVGRNSPRIAPYELSFFRRITFH